MKVEAVRGSLAVWLLRRVQFGPWRLVRLGQPRFAPIVRAAPPVDARCACRPAVHVSATERTEPPKLELHWPSDDVPPPDPIVIRVRDRYAPPIAVGDFFDIFF